MSAAVREEAGRTHVERLDAQAAKAAQVALLGTGNVGGAVLERLQALASATAPGRALSLRYVANSTRSIRDGAGLVSADPVHSTTSASRELLTRVRHAATPGVPCARAARAARDREVASAVALDRLPSVFDRGATCIVIDATASGQVARHHAQWLARGIHVVTACKLGAGSGLDRWRDIAAAASRAGTVYGDAATVGAGLPLLRCIRELRAGGDRIHAIEGVLSGSLAWLFNRYDGSIAFSELVAAACAAGYTEPDPREDLSGEDVRRKLLIIARAAGCELDAADVDVHSLVQPRHAANAAAHGAQEPTLEMLDPGMSVRHASALRGGRVLRHVARLDTRGPAPRAQVGLMELAPDHPLAGGSGTDNVVAIWSDRYPTRPLRIQGPGAGAAVTAAGLLDDALRIAASCGRDSAAAG